MKKFFTLIAALVATVSMNAQSLQFCDANGNVFEEGATITMNGAEESDFGDTQVPLTGVWISNPTEDDINGATLRVTIDTFAGDGFSCCFGTNCRRINNAGVMDITGVEVEAGKSVELKNTEWIVVPEQYESLAAKFELIDGMETVATLNVNFVYDENSAHINGVNANANVSANIYNLAGQQLRSLQKGINIVDGKKIMVK